MEKIITLKDKITRKSIYPITIPKAVVTGVGESLEDKINEFIEETLSSLEIAVQRSIAAEESIALLTNLPELSQEIIDSLKTTIDENTRNIIELESKYKNLTSSITNLLKKSDLTNDVIGELGKVPTGMAVRNYLADTALNITEYLIKTTEGEPNYAPLHSGQILVNEETNEVFISSCNSGTWLKLNATPLILEQELIEASMDVDSETLIVSGNVYMDDNTLSVPNTEEVRNDTLYLELGNKPSIEGSTLVVENTTVDNQAITISNAEKVENNTLIF